MSIKNTKTFTKEQIQNAISLSSSMGHAATVLGVDKRTFKKEAEKYGLYKTVGQKNTKFELSDILSGKYPQYPTSKLLPRMVAEGICEYRCTGCQLDSWNGKRIGLELDHIDGNNANHMRDNLRALCPNCHSQTETYRSKKLKFLRLNK